MVGAVPLAKSRHLGPRGQKSTVNGQSSTVGDPGPGISGASGKGQFCGRGLPQAEEATSLELILLPLALLFSVTLPLNFTTTSEQALILFRRQ
jgi:hypothetical protein